MANVNTIKQQIQTYPVLSTIQNTITPLTNAVAGTTATAFALNSGAVSLGGGGVIPLSVGTPGRYAGTGRKLRLHALGQCVSGTTATLTLKLYEVPLSVIAAAGFSSNNVSLLSQTTFTGWNLIATSTAQNVNTTTGAWDVLADFQLTYESATTYTLQGTFRTTINGIFQTDVALTQATALVGEADLNFVVVSTMSASNSGTTNYLLEFSIEEI